MGNQKYKVLYIEDDLATQQLVTRVLDKDSFEIFLADNGLDGLKMVDTVEPDVVLMDLGLPDLTGLELSTKIKSNPRTKNTIIIAVTGRVEFSSREKTLIAGCDGYIPKPFNIESINSQILEFVHGKKETVAPEDREQLISEFQVELVNKLEEKVIALQSVNALLEESNQLLTNREQDVRHQNEKLIQLHSISNHLHRIKTLDEFMTVLPELISGKLGFDRCILFQFDIRKNKIIPSTWSGFKDSNPKDLQLNYDQQQTDLLINKHTSTIISTVGERKEDNIDQIPYYNDLTKFLKASKFMMGYIGPIQGRRILNKFDDEEINHTFEKLLNNIYEKIEPENLHAELEKYLTSNLYKFTGFIYVDNAISNREINTFDNRILATLVETAKTVYENISLIQILQKLYFKAGQDAITDPLTGISNYRFFINQLIRELNRAQRYRIPLSLAMIDIDFFKVYNDSFGHLAGDYVLRTLSHLLKENTRISDIVARYGGEEFVIILPEATKEEAFKLAEKVRSIIEKYDFVNQEKMPHGNLTISCGVSSYPEDGNLPELLIEHADMAMYEAKNSGKNKVCIYNKNGKPE